MNRNLEDPIYLQPNSQKERIFNSINNEVKQPSNKISISNLKANTQAQIYDETSTLIPLYSYKSNEKNINLKLARSKLIKTCFGIILICLLSIAFYFSIFFQEKSSAVIQNTEIYNQNDVNANYRHQQVKQHQNQQQKKYQIGKKSNQQLSGSSKNLTQSSYKTNQQQNINKQTENFIEQNIHSVQKVDTQKQLKIQTKTTQLIAANNTQSSHTQQDKDQSTNNKYQTLAVNAPQISQIKKQNDAVGHLQQKNIKQLKDQLPSTSSLGLQSQIQQKKTVLQQKKHNNKQIEAQQRQQQQQQQQQQHQRQQQQQQQQQEQQEQQEQQQAQFGKDQYQEFKVQKNVFIYPKKQQSSNYLNMLQLENNKQYAKQSKFQVHVINETNYNALLSSKTAKRLSKTIIMLKERSQDRLQRAYLLHSVNQVIKKIVLFTLLQQNGGIIITQPLTLTQNFSWIAQIQSNIYVNRGHDDAQPEVVGFYSPLSSSARSHEQLRRTKKAISYVQNQIIVLPNIQLYFIAAKKNSRFISELVDQLYKILEEPDIAKQYINSKQYDMKGINSKVIYTQFVAIAAKKIIQEKQNQLNKRNKGKNQREFAIDYYGLFLINRNYGPFKLDLFWTQSQAAKIYYNLARYDYRQLQANIGPVKYMVFLSPQNAINAELSKTKQNNNNNIVKGSFIHRFLFLNRNQPFIQQNKQKPFISESFKPWSSLPKQIWIYWDTGIKNSGLSNQVCVQNLKRFGDQSGFKLNQLNDSNLNQYLDKQILQKIKYSISHAKVQTFPQTKSDLYRLAIIQKHGGIYLDASYIALQNFNWLINIGSYPSEYIFNRYGQLPKILMLFHPHYGSPFSWYINQQVNSKIQWHLAYQNNLIIAQKGNQLIRQWLELYLQLLLKPYQQIRKIFQENLVADHAWTTKNSQYLLAMDTIKCVIGRRQIWIKNQKSKQWYGQDASDYYKIWSMSGYLGQQKLRSNTNFQNQDKEDNYFLTRYSKSYVQGLLGKFRHLVKFYNHHSKEVSQFIEQGYGNNFTTTAHPKSIFMKYIYNKKIKFEVRENKLRLQN